MKKLADLPLEGKQLKDRNKEEGLYSIKHPWVKSDYLIADVKFTNEAEMVAVRVVQPVNVSKAVGRNRFPTVQELMAIRNLFFTPEEKVWTPIPVDREQYFAELVCARVDKVQQAIAQLNEEGGKDVKMDVVKKRLQDQAEQEFVPE